MKMTKNKCFECKCEIELYQHHVVPQVKGGVNTITLCGDCHSKVHDSNLSTKYLTRLALFKKSKLLLCRIFFLITMEMYNHRQVAKDLTETLGYEFDEKKVAARVRRLKKIDIDDILAEFEDVIITQCYGKAFYKLRWSYYLHEMSLHYTLRNVYTNDPK